MKRKSSRRDFLRGKSAVHAVANALQDALPAAESTHRNNRSDEDAYVVHVSRRAMACDFEVRLNAGQYDHGTEIALGVLDLVDELEEQLSVFREASDICRINRTAAQSPVEVEPRLFALLDLAVRLHGETGGAFDITSAPLWETWGFARREGTVPDDEQITKTLERVGSQHVELDAEHQTIRFRRRSVQINLGSIGKGYALDRCAEKLSEAGVEDFLIHGGRSSVLAHGRQRSMRDPSSGSHASPWRVGVPHPLRSGRRLAEIRLADRALATSGSQRQSFVYAGRRYGHILDPRTGRPAAGVVSATAIAPTAALADALSTAFYVMGPDKALKFCRTRPELAAVLVCPVRHGGGVEIQTAGVTDEELTLL